MAFVHPDHDCHAVSQAFVKCLRIDGWVITNVPVSHPNFGDSFIGHCRLIVAIHLNTKPKCEAFALHTPPLVLPKPLARFLWEPFNTPKHAISFSKDDPSFNLHAVNNNGAPRLLASLPTPAQIALLDAGSHIAYYLHQEQDNPNVLTGAAVMKPDRLCPPFDPADNLNLFGHYFGIKFIHDKHTNLPLAYA